MESAPEPVAGEHTMRLATLALVGALAFALRAVVLVQLRDVPLFDAALGDGRAYWERAGAILAGESGHEPFYQAPLYPYFLAGLRALGAGVVAVRVVQVALGALAVVLLVDAAWCALGRRAALGAALLLVPYVPLLFLEVELQKGALTSLTCALVAWSAVRVALDERASLGRVAALGGLLGLAALNREEALAAAPLLALWLLRTTAPGGARRGAAFLAGLALALAPVTLHNLAAGELVVTTAQAGPNFWIGNHSGATGTYAPLRPGRGDAKHERIDARLLAEQDVGHELGHAQVSRYWMRRTLGEIGASPGAWLALLATKLALAFNGHEVADTVSLVWVREQVGLLAALCWLFDFDWLGPLALAGLWLVFRDRGSEGLRARAAPLVILAAAQLACLVGFYVFARYRLPLALYLAPFAGLAVARGAASLVALVSLSSRAEHEPDSRSGGGAALDELRSARGVITVFLLGALVSHWPLELEGDEVAVSWANAAIAAHEAGDEAGFRAATARAIQLGSVSAQVNLAVALGRGGHPERAAEMFAQIARRYPADPRLWKRLGTALGEAGDWAGARACLERSYLLFPADEETASNLGAALEELGALDELREHLARHSAEFPEHASIRTALEALR